MNEIVMCGKRGLGDVICGLSALLKTIKSDTHIKFCYPGDVPTYNYKVIFDTLMNNFELPPFNITHEYDSSWYTIDERKAIKLFGAENKGKTWWFSYTGNRTVYTPFKKKWEGNSRGPIALSLNYDEFKDNPHNHLYGEKFFNKNINDMLMSLIDNKNYFLLDRHTTLQGCIDILAKCRYALGIEGAYTHLSNCTRTPYIIVRNDHKLKTITNCHHTHPALKVIETDSVGDYLY